MNFTQRMVALLAELRRERNGAVAGEMRVYGAPYGLNYGVSLPTVRAIARAEQPDSDFAAYLYLQDVRELRLVALHIAEPGRLTPAGFPAWAAGIVNSEVAEEIAFALLSRADVLPELFDAWTADPNPLLQYAALMAASRSRELRSEWIDPAVEVVRRNAANSALPEYAARLTAQGAVALLAAIGMQNKENRLAVLHAAGSLGKLPAENFVHEELAWRLDC